MKTLLLDTAAAVIAERGYEAATLTDVAARAGASIGSLYRYFPDKAAVARALAERYGGEIAERWQAWAAEAGTMNLDGLIDRMVDLVVRFMEERPAYVPLLSAARDYRHTPADRDALRGHIVAFLRTHGKHLDEPEALRVANVVVELIKALGQLYGRQPADRTSVVSEFRLLLRSYLRTRLLPAAADR